MGETSPMIQCARHGHIEIAKLLIKHGDENIINHKMEWDGSTPLHNAAANDQPEMCELLLSSSIQPSVDVSRRDKLG